MKIFLDSANIEQIKTAYDMGAITGVTTNPSIISRENRKFDDLLTDITAIITDGPVFAEVLSVDAEGMIEEGRKLAAKSKNIVVKIPMIPEGLKAVKTLSSEGITVCNTVGFLLLPGYSCRQRRRFLCCSLRRTYGRHRRKRT